MIEKLKGTGVPRARVVCDECSREEVFPAGYESGRNTHDKRSTVIEGPVIQKATKQGWSYVKGVMRCPACEAKRKADAAAKKQEIKTMTDTVTELRQPTREQKRQIMAMLEASYDTKAGRYTGGDTDKTVAETIGGGVMPGWVSEIREEFFGPDGGNDDMEIVVAELKSAREALTALRGELVPVMETAHRIENDMRQHKERIDRAISRIETIKTAVGPKAARA